MERHLFTMVFYFIFLMVLYDNSLILYDLLHLAAKDGRLEIVEYLGQKNVNLETFDKYGMTPLHYGFLFHIFIGFI